MPSPANQPTPPARRLPVLLRRAWYGLNQAFRQRIAHLKITPDQFSILRWLDEGDASGMTQRELTDMMSSDANTIASTLQRMERNGLLERTPHERDRRAHRVRLLAKGRRVFEKARAAATELQTGVLGSISAAEREKFLHQLDTIATACSDAVSKTATKKSSR